MQNQQIEYRTPQDIIRFQEQLLREQLVYLAFYSPYYSRFFKANNIDIESIKTLVDLSSLPVTTKETIQAQNEDFYCVPKDKIVDYVTTSGTSGTPINFVLSENDIERLALNEYLSMQCAGITHKDIVQLTTTIDRSFMAGMAYFLGLRKIGAGVIRVGPGIPELQWDTIARLKPNVLIAVPSFIVKMIVYAELHQIDFQNSSIEKAICIGEAIRNEDFSLNALGRRITEKWNIQLHSSYASTEMSTAFTECGYHHGGHHQPELVIAELLDEHNTPVKAGEKGELTITTLGVEAMPLLRYKTGDICTFHYEPCACGRNTKRISPIFGRKNQMIKYKGTTLSPAALRNVLHDIEGIKRHVTEVYTNTLGNDELTIHIVYDGNTIELHEILISRFRAALRVVPVINFCTDSYINDLLPSTYARKPIDFIDNRV